MTFNWIIVALAVPSLMSAARIQLIDISPEEAQKLITQQSLDLRYATKLGEGSASGRSYNGKIIDSDDYTEELYEANQFHGQDGLGRAIFGYTDNQQSRLEARNANGEVRGQYQYIDPWGNDIQVQYWVDSLGFHQTDNIPKFALQPVTETPEVKQAREEHERLWKAAARLSGADPDANDLYSPNADKLDDESYDNDDEGELEGQVSNQHQSLTRYPVLPYSGHIAPDNAKQFGNVVDDSVIVDATNINEQRSRFARQQDGVDEVTGEPRGFFYSFDYQVPFIVDHNARLRQAAGDEGQASENVESIIDIRVGDNEIGSQTKAVEVPIQQRSSVSESIRDKIIVEDEVHDVQTSPKQRQSSEMERITKQEVPTESLEKQEVPTEIIAKEKLPSESIAKQEAVQPKTTRGRGSMKFNGRKN